MLRASLVAIVMVLAQAGAGSPEFSTSRFYYAARLIGALLIATVVPLLIDRRACRSDRTRI
jgi:hypothetical protein